MDQKKVAHIVKSVFSSEHKTTAGEINIVFVGRREICRLNRFFLNTSGDTDVIAFPGEKNDGDIFICRPVAEQNARRFREPRRRELMRLVIHGTLHLLGFADWPAIAKKKMWARQEKLVNSLWGQMK